MSEPLIQTAPLPLLQLNNIQKRFGSTQVLKSVHMTAYPGEIIALLGDNGAGKSTLIKLLTGFHIPDEGEIFWEGKPIRFQENNGPQLARKLGIEAVYQDLGLVDSLSISRNFFLGRELTRRYFGIPCLDHKKMAETVTQRLKEIGIRRALHPNDQVEQLSGGERQAIAICRAQYFGAKLLILDEPTSALSLPQTQQVLNSIRNASKAGIAVIYITHTLIHIQNLVDRVIVLYKGQKVKDGLMSEFQLGEIEATIMHGI